MGEVDQLQDAVHHRVAEGDQRVDAAEHEAVQDLLEQDFEVEHCWPLAVPARRRTAALLGENRQTRGAGVRWGGSAARGAGAQRRPILRDARNAPGGCPG